MSIEDGAHGRYFRDACPAQVVEGLGHAYYLGDPRQRVL